MDFEWSQEHDMMRQAVKDIASDYDEEYWREVRAERRVPKEIYNDLADGGWLGIPIPEEYGGQGMGILEVVLMMQALGEERVWEISVSDLIFSMVFGGVSVTKNGTEAQKEELLPGIVNGDRWSLGLTEADAGLNTTNITTVAEPNGSEYVINGQKMWTSGIDEADKLLVLARTTPKDEVNSGGRGLTQFIVDDPSNTDGIEYSELPLDIYYPDRTYQVNIDNLRVPEENVLGEVDEGLYQIFDMLNVERMTAGTGIWAAGMYCIDKAVEYANQREVFDGPIGQYQGIQHPLADSFAELESAKGTLERAAWQFDNNVGDVGEISNVANLQAGKAAWNACEAAMQTFGGSSVSAELGIAAAWATVRHLRIAPVSEEMIRNHIAQHSLGLPRSY